MTNTQNILTIETDSQAGRYIAMALDLPSTYKLSFHARDNGASVAIKINEQMWSPSLTTTKRSTDETTNDETVPENPDKSTATDETAVRVSWAFPTI